MISRDRNRLGRALRQCFYLPFAPAAAISLRFRSRGVENKPECDILDFAYHWRFGRIGIAPAQIRSEFVRFLELVRERRPRVLLEIGTYNGGSLFCLTRVACPGALLVSIDLPGGLYGGGYPAWRSMLYQQFPYSGQKLHLLRSNSHEQGTFETVLSSLSGRKVDVLFIDGDHSYEGVRRDFELYKTLLAQGGILVFHDIVPGNEDYVPGQNSVGGVPLFWREVKKHGQIVEFVEDWNQGGFGIGCILRN